MTTQYRLVRRLSDRQALLTRGGSHFVASFAPVDGGEVLVFPATSSGEVTGWVEVDGGRGYGSLDQFLVQYVR